ncbi:MAG TPA: hypothetical protein VGT44_03800 [Ktedonobacteraceae bacterium]|nr:hypothetical protein [Ktedonobacteraceae bacterium]
MSGLSVAPAVALLATTGARPPPASLSLPNAFHRAPARAGTEALER